MASVIQEDKLLLHLLKSLFWIVLTPKTVLLIFRLLSVFLNQGQYHSFFCSVCTVRDYQHKVVNISTENKMQNSKAVLPWTVNYNKTWVCNKPQPEKCILTYWQTSGARKKMHFGKIKFMEEIGRIARKGKDILLLLWLI